MAETKAARNISSALSITGQFRLAFTYITCPKCGKRLFQVRASAKKPRVYLVDEDHPVANASMTTKCDRCRSIVAVET